jgi:hypothetical protein
MSAIKPLQSPISNPRSRFQIPFILTGLTIMLLVLSNTSLQTYDYRTFGFDFFSPPRISRHEIRALSV